MSERKKYLDQRLVTDFAEYRSLYNALEDWIDLVRPQIRAKLQEGYLCPTKGPYLLVMHMSSKPAVDWEKAFREHRIDDYVTTGLVSRADAEKVVTQEMMEIVAATGTITYPVIRTRPNPALAGKGARGVIASLTSKLKKFVKPDKKKAA